MARGFGLSLSERGAIAVQVAGNAKKPKLVKAVELIYDELDEIQAAKEAGLEEIDLHEVKLQQLKKWLKKEGLAGSPLTLVIPNDYVILRDMRLAFSDRRQIDKVIDFQVESVIPSTPVEDLSVSYNMLSSDENGSNLLVAAAYREAISSRIEDLKSIKMQPANADSGIGGVLNLLKVHPELREVAEPTMWIDLQESHALLTILDEDGVRTMRSMRIPLTASLELRAAHNESAQPEEAGASEDSSGTASLTATPESEVQEPETAPANVDSTNSDAIEVREDAVDELSLEEHDETAAEKAARVMREDAELEADSDVLQKTGPDDVQDQPLPPAAPKQLAGEAGRTGLYRYEDGIPHAEALVRLLRIELRRVALARGGDAEISRLVISGAPTTLRVRLEGLAKETDLSSVEFIDLLDPILPRNKSGQPSIDVPHAAQVGVVAGAALTNLGIDGSEINFLSGDLSPTDAFDEVKVPIMTGLVIAMLLSFGAMLLVWQQVKEERKTRDDAVRELKLPILHEQTFLDHPGTAPSYLNGRAAAAIPSREQIKMTEKQMDAVMNEIRGGKKANYPPIFDATIMYAEFLKVVANLEKQQGRASPRNFLLEEFQFNQSTRGEKTTGTLRIEFWMENTQQFVMKDLLKQIEVPNPAYNGTKDTPQAIKPFAKSTIDENMGEVKDRAVRTVGTRDKPVRVRKYTFTLKTEEIVRVAKATGSGGSRRSNRR